MCSVGPANLSVVSSIAVAFDIIFYVGKQEIVRNWITLLMHPQSCIDLILSPWHDYQELWKYIYTQNLLDSNTVGSIDAIKMLSSEPSVDLAYMVDVFVTVTTISQRHSSPEFQPPTTDQLYPRHKHLLIKQSLRCRVFDEVSCLPNYPSHLWIMPRLNTQSKRKALELGTCLNNLVNGNSVSYISRQVICTYVLESQVEIHLPELIWVMNRKYRLARLYSGCSLLKHEHPFNSQYQLMCLLMA